MTKNNLTYQDVFITQKGKTIKVTVTIEKNTDLAFHPYTVSALGFEFSGKNIKTLMKDLIISCTAKLGWEV